jgi:hypothetical protein
MFTIKKLDWREAVLVEVRGRARRCHSIAARQPEVRS